MFAGNDNRVERPFKLVMKRQVGVGEGELVVAVAHAPCQGTGVVGEPDDAMVQVHPLRKFHDLARLRQVHKEEHLGFAASPRFHPRGVRRDNLL